MGHYDEQYERDASISYEAQKDDCKSKIRTELYNMNLNQLQLILVIIQNIDGIEALGNILNKMKK